MTPQTALAKLSILLPRYEGEPQLVVIPLSTTMSWVSSPPTFCAASKTVADLANTSLYKRMVPPHCLEDLVSTHDHWQLYLQIQHCEELSSPAKCDPLAMTISPLAADPAPTHRAGLTCLGDSTPATTLSPLASNPLALD